MKLRQARKLAKWYERRVRYSEPQMRQAQNRLINSGKREYRQPMGTVRRDQDLTLAAHEYREAMLFGQTTYPSGTAGSYMGAR